MVEDLMGEVEIRSEKGGYFSWRRLDLMTIFPNFVFPAHV